MSLAVGGGFSLIWTSVGSENATCVHVHVKQLVTTQKFVIELIGQDAWLLGRAHVK